MIRANLLVREAVLSVLHSSSSSQYYSENTSIEPCSGKQLSVRSKNFECSHFLWPCTWVCVFCLRPFTQWYFNQMWTWTRAPGLSSLFLALNFKSQSGVVYLCYFITTSEVLLKSPLQLSGGLTENIKSWYTWCHYYIYGPVYARGMATIINFERVSAFVFHLLPLLNFILKSL